MPEFQCPSCSREVPPDSRVCPYCAAPVSTAPFAVTASVEVPFGSSSSDSIDNARFTPGTMLASRYRIVGLAGRGGMGEVYRADDLKLRQPVALKFLPETLSRDEKKLERFIHEVRVARQVSHPNVCRVYDIAEADGQHFISMEYVDGEDLSAVLRRMGRPSKEKALQITRQLCAGLAAAHDKGVLHRDLKPHNVMIDGQGRVRITDFGLAGFAGDFVGKEVYAGTPAYMAPEQLAGRGVSVKSDIYSLGLVLGELFTGKRIFEGSSREQIQNSRSAAPTSLSTLSDDLDPAIERVILRCLQPDPTVRPSSALAVAASLPGADPLAAALEAGETPSPEMVAAAGDVGGMRPAIAVACLIAIIGGVLILVPLNRTSSLIRLIALPKPPEALADRAAEILKKLGHSAPISDSADSFYVDEWCLRHIEETDKSANRWDQLEHLRPSPVRFLYRASPRPLIPAPTTDRVDDSDPPMTVSGMALIALDPKGRLLHLELVPPERETKTEEDRAPHPTDWSILFTEAQIDPESFSPVEPLETPNNYCDERKAWEGRFPDQPDIPIRIEAGAYRGTPISMKIIAPWTKAWRMEEWPRTYGQKVGDVLVLCIFFSLVFGGALLARRNLKLRRSDRVGADRLAMACFGLLVVSWVLVIDHVADFWGEFNRLRVLVGGVLVAVAVMWLWYIALEPYVRRRWPHALISWSRLLAGRFRDPLVGRDVLIGGVFALVPPFLDLADIWGHVLLGQPPAGPRFPRWDGLLGLRFQIGQILDTRFVFFALLVFFLLLGLRLILRKGWLAIVAVFLLQSVVSYVGRSGDDSTALVILHLVIVSLMWCVFVFVPLRFGLLALVSCFFFGNLLRDPSLFGLSGWPSQTSWTAIIFTTAVALYAFQTALAGRALLHDDLLEP